jgi:AAA+ ATPase superfamily predicted ATPase
MSVDKSFIDRVDVSSTMMKRVEAFNRGYRQNIGILGEAYMGKSTLLHQFVLSFPHQHMIPIYIEVAPEPFDYFAKKFMGTVLHSYIRTSGLLIPDSFDGLVKRTRKYLPQTLKQMRAIRQCVQSKDIAKAFCLLLTLTDTLAKDTGRKIILIIDEFDSMEQFGIKDMFTTLSHEIMVQTDTMYVVSSSHAEHAENIFREKLSLLFGNFETLRILSFNFVESAQFITKALAGIRIDPLYIKFLIRLTDGHPYYLNLIVVEMKRMLRHPQDAIDEHNIINALTQLLFYTSGALHQHFLLKLNRFYKSCSFYVYINVLVAISEGMRKINSIARFIEKDKEETKKVLQRLHEEQLIEKSGYFYVIPDSMLKFWIRYVYARKITALGVNDGCDENRFREEVSDLVDSSCHEEYKELSKRVEELLRSFNNDVVEVNAKRMKCPNFHEVYLRPTNGRIYPLYAKSNSTRWLCQVAQMKVEEEDIQILVTDSKKMRKKVNKRVLITPHGISLNAKLMAKQEKIDIWNLRNLNFIFDLYDKPKIIV